jgi:hypothetical protein
MRTAPMTVCPRVQLPEFGAGESALVMVFLWASLAWLNTAARGTFQHIYSERGLLVMVFL